MNRMKIVRRESSRQRKKRVEKDKKESANKVWGRVGGGRSNSFRSKKRQSFAHQMSATLLSMRKNAKETDRVLSATTCLRKAIGSPTAPSSATIPHILPGGQGEWLGRGPVEGAGSEKTGGKSAFLFGKSDNNRSSGAREQSTAPLRYYRFIILFSLCLERNGCLVDASFATQRPIGLQHGRAARRPQQRAQFGEITGKKHRKLFLL